MGANQQTSVPAFTAGQVLTAQQQTEINTGIPVFADSTARTAAFGGTGEKVLAEGQYSYLEDTNSTEVYDGSGWVAVGAGAGLSYITGAAFSAVSSVSLANGTFTSTYRNYRVIISITDNSVDNEVLYLRMRAAGVDDTTGYYGGIFGVTYLADTLRVQRTNNGTAFNWGLMRTTVGHDQSYSFDLINPEVAEQTEWNGTAWATILLAANDTGPATFAGREGSATQFDALTFYPGSGTITGTYRVYGYADS